MIEGASFKFAQTRFSLRLKLTLWTLAIALALQTAVGAAVFFYQRVRINQFFDARIARRASTIAAGVKEVDVRVADEDLRHLSEDMGRFTPLEPAVITLFSAGGEVVASTLRPPPPLPHPGPTASTLPTIAMRRILPGFQFSGDDDPHVRVLLEQLHDSSGRAFTLLTATPDSNYEYTLGLTGWVLLAALGMGAFAAGIGGWFVAGLATGPIGQTRRLAETLSPDSLQKEVKLPTASPEVAALQQDLREARARLLQAFQAQDRFVSSVSHELKTPIAVLLTEAQTLDVADLPEDARLFVLSVTEEMRRLGGMVESFLTLTKIRGGKTVLSTAKLCGINEVVMEAIDSCKKMAGQYHVMLIPQLSDADPPPTASGSAELLRVMVDNLVRNAIRFSPENHQVVIHVGLDRSECTIGVRDLGPGVPSTMLDKVFDRFVQAPTEDQLSRGHGLGLSIAQGVAELHGGRISVHNIEGGGCEFSVQLPLAQPTGVGKDLNPTDHVKESAPAGGRTGGGDARHRDHARATGARG